MTISEDATAADVAAVYDQMLAPSFPPAELQPLEHLEQAIASGASTMRVVRDTDGVLLAAAIGTVYAASGTMLLEYLVTSPLRRGGGVGGRLLDEALDAWVSQRGVDLILAEVERPDAVPAHLEHGDPARRVAFYSKHGGRALALPYFQPALGTGGTRVGNMMLVALAIAPALKKDSAVASAPVLDFLTAYLTASEGHLASDQATSALLAPLQASDWCPLVALDDVSAVPVAAL